ncbi:MAG: adenylate kinase family protein [Planctomycetota bacterium]|jgi:adenylate kinase
MRIVLLGAPGAGKGTQCKRIVEKYGLQHLSSGDILRQERAAETDLGKKAQSYMDSGALVPDELIVEMMAGAINKVPGAGFVLDGFPRTINQAAELGKSLDSSGTTMEQVLFKGPMIHLKLWKTALKTIVNKPSLLCVIIKAMARFRI